MFQLPYTAPEDGNVCREDPTDIRGSTDPCTPPQCGDVSTNRGGCGAGDIADPSAYSQFDVIYAGESTDCYFVEGL